MTTDYSQLHQLAGDLFTMPKTAGEWERFRLSNEQVEFFRD